MPKPNEYKHIRAWGKFMGSYEYYIKNQQETAADDNAPLDAIYKRRGAWRCFSEVENEDTRETVKAILLGLR